jgi:Icc-related predicted phosphoesterase
MKLTFISDTHGLHKHYTSESFNNLLGQGDVLIHAGDISSLGKKSEIYGFLKWISNVDYTHKVFIAGNHDWWFEKNTELPNEFQDKNVHYLFDSMIEIDGLKIYGSPWQPEFYNWAFNLPRNGSELGSKWSNIPQDLDILVTHSPPYKILDKTPSGESVGCELLFNKVMEVRPKIHVFGHIHWSFGKTNFMDIDFFNASMLSEEYRPLNKPIKINYDIFTKKFDFI